MGEGSARTEMQRRLIEKSLQDEDFRRRLMEDPKGAVEQELGTRLPEGVEVRTVEETAETIYLVLPATPMAGREGLELSNQELESVAGGWLEANTMAGQMSCGSCNCIWSVDDCS